jgi:hypothetical protein
MFRKLLGTKKRGTTAAWNLEMVRIGQRAI